MLFPGRRLDRRRRGIGRVSVEIIEHLFALFARHVTGRRVVLIQNVTEPITRVDRRIRLVSAEKNDRVDEFYRRKRKNDQNATFFPSISPSKVNLPEPSVSKALKTRSANLSRSCSLRAVGPGGRRRGVRVKKIHFFVQTTEFFLVHLIVFAGRGDEILIKFFHRRSRNA